MRKWEISKVDKQLAKVLAEECDIDPFVAMLASSRGYDDPVLLEQFLSDETVFADPYELKDIVKAAECINGAIENNETIAVYGDYDCDGVTATALLYSYLLERNANVLYHIPDRFEEGYGMNITAIDSLKVKGVSLIITVDNGISCYDEIEYAKKLGIKVVVSDHHLPPEKTPDAEAVINPHQSDDISGFKEVCGVAVAFKLVCAIEHSMPEEMIWRYGDLVALGTLGDVMPLVNENRSFVKAGFGMLKNGNRLGVKTLLQVAGLNKDDFSVSRITFGLVPRINAAGRMGSAKRALELLICKDNEKALLLAEEINGENISRQEIEKEIYKEAKNLIEVQGLYRHRVIVVAGESWHHGIVGIVASRICEHYGKPAIVLSTDGEISHGSGRSIEGFSLYDAINSAALYTEKFGGHEQAAGMTIKRENIEAFRNAVNLYASRCKPVIPVLKLDCKLNPAAINLDLVYSLKELAPFGTGNPVPVFGIYGVQIEKITSIAGDKHLKISFIKGAVVFQAVLFSCGEKAFPFSKGEIIDIAVTLDTNFYNGKEYLSIQIKDYRYSGVKDDDLAFQRAVYDDFSNGVNADYKAFAPEIDQCRAVYKYMLHKDVACENVIQHFMNDIGYAKVKIILDILKEMSLVDVNITANTEILSVANKGGKVKLEDSKILKRVRG
ncbi:MAG: single-stranded-DNA-specific exonuclease RecJ [Ruminococcaceae bacterium]|nr:single-stranded-DNA-specific exonuclease RecJ [Oscillospiraceae bacterium]